MDTNTSLTPFETLKSIELEVSYAAAVLDMCAESEFGAAVHLKRALSLILQLKPKTTESGDALAALVDAAAANGCIKKNRKDEGIAASRKILEFNGYSESNSNQSCASSEIELVERIINGEIKSLRRQLYPNVYLRALDFFSLPPGAVLGILLIGLYSIGALYGQSFNPVKWFPTGLEQFEIKNVEQGWGTMLINRSVGGSPLVMFGQKYRRGIGTHANAAITLGLRSKARYLTGLCGVDDEMKGKGSIVCSVWVNGIEQFKSPTIKGGTKPVEFRVSVDGASEVVLKISDAGDNIDHDHADIVSLTLE